MPSATPVPLHTLPDVRRETPWEQWRRTALIISMVNSNKDNIIIIIQPECASGGLSLVYSRKAHTDEVGTPTYKTGLS